MADEPPIGTTIPLPPSPTGWFAYGYAVLATGSLAVLRSDVDIKGAYARMRDETKHGQTPAPLPSNLWHGLARLSVFDGNFESAAIEVPIGFAPKFDRFADGRWLLVSSRTSESQTNGRLYTPTGQSAGQLDLGDGISHVRCARDDKIWVGYFDEGLFSPQNSSGAWPVSAAGIACFGQDGEVLASFNDGVDRGLFVSDCYALTLRANEVWSCSYTDFPIVSIDGGTTRHWSNGITGANALATDGAHVLLCGGYGDNSIRIALLRLYDDHACNLGDLPYLPLRDADHVQGHGDTLHIIGHGCWTRIDVACVRAKLGC